MKTHTNINFIIIAQSCSLLFSSQFIYRYIYIIAVIKITLQGRHYHIYQSLITHTDSVLNFFLNMKNENKDIIVCNKLKKKNIKLKTIRFRKLDLNVSRLSKIKFYIKKNECSKIAEMVREIFFVTCLFLLLLLFSSLIYFFFFRVNFRFPHRWQNLICPLHCLNLLSYVVKI